MFGAKDVLNTYTELRTALQVQARQYPLGTGSYGVYTRSNEYDIDDVELANTYIKMLPVDSPICVIGAYLIGKQASLLGGYVHTAAEHLGVHRAYIEALIYGWDSYAEVEPTNVWAQAIAYDSAQAAEEGRDSWNVAPHWIIGYELAREFLRDTNTSWTQHRTESCAYCIHNWFGVDDKGTCEVYNCSCPGWHHKEI